MKVNIPIFIGVLFLTGSISCSEEKSKNEKVTGDVHEGNEEIINHDPQIDHELAGNNNKSSYLAQWV